MALKRTFGWLMLVSLCGLLVGNATAQDATRGKIQGVSFKNINVTGGKLPRSRINGFDDGHKVTGVTITNMTVLGRPIRSLTDGNFLVNAFMDQPVFSYDMSGILGRKQTEAEAELPILRMIPGTRSTLLYRRPEEKSGTAYNAMGKLIPLDASRLGAHR